MIPASYSGDPSLSLDLYAEHAVASWLRYYATSRKVVDSKPDKVNNVFDLLNLSSEVDRLCGLLVGVPGYRSRGPGSIPDATRFS
jgi:hypothetical protein